MKEVEKRIIAHLLPQENGSPDEMAINEITQEQIKEDPAAILNELSSVSFFADERVIKISQATDSMLAAIEQALPQASKENFLLITAGELTPASKLRKLFEGSKEHMTVLCYRDDEVSVRQVIRTKLNEAKIQFDNDTLEFLAANLGEDRLITQSEIEKIIVYAGSEKQIHFEDAAKILASSSQITLSDLAFSVSSRNSELIEKNLTRVFSEHIAAVAILRSLSWHFERMLQVKNAVQTNPNVDSAVKSLRPQVFFRQVAQFKTDVMGWSLPQLYRALELIKETELAVKQGKAGEQILCRNLLLKLATKPKARAA